MSWNLTPEDREKKRAYDAERRAWQTPERKAYMKAWHKANPRDRRAYKRSYDAANRERIAAYRAANAERMAAYWRQHYAENPARVKANAARHMARLRGAEGSHTLEEWQAKCAEYGHLCAYCGEARPLTRDHVVPVSVGGSDYIANVVPACRRCNSSKQARPADEFRRTLLRRTG